ncbi:hypothetical protein EDB80DRAFT_898423 [Ilyonectria destructans]|nr:hypothetical protein EDB80DRAFT_898423 [Ilyonectria destructans]
MDPMTAPTVATSVIAFVEFGGKLIGRYFEVRETTKGQPPDLLRLKEATQELKTVASDAQKSLKELNSSQSKYSGSFDKKLTANPNSRLTYRGSQAIVAIKSLWSESDTKKWNEKLSRIKQRVKMNVDEARQTHELAVGIDEGGDFKKITTGRKLADSSEEERLTDAIWASTSLLDLKRPTGKPAPPKKPPHISVVHDPELNENPIFEKVLKSLKFNGMSERGDRTTSAHPKTFDWLFTTQTNQDKPVNLPLDAKSMNFLQWLQSQNDTIFWITGKPASGKSTLMKFILTHGSLYDHLRVWAGEATLIVASFYFWGPGSTIQKSRVGLLRSLLYQLLVQQPELCELVTARRWAFFSQVGINAKSPEWEWTELRRCLERFANQIKNTSRLALLVDGLDEYDEIGDQDRPQDEDEDDYQAQNQAQEEMISFLKTLHEDYNPKICVSSRTWPIFSDAFSQNPSLKMEALTQTDIDIYVDDHFSKGRAIQDLRLSEPKTIEKLTEEVKNEAEGVFLWVVLVVEQLVITARNCPLPSALRKKFSELPKGLERLYQSIQSNIKGAEKSNASRLYQLIIEWKSTVNSQIEAGFLWLSLECYEYKRWTVDFLHRTVFDWLRKKDNWTTICCDGPSDFNPILTLIAILASQLRESMQPADRAAPATPSFILKRDLILRILKLSSKIENTPESRSKLVTILDQVATEWLLPVEASQWFEGTMVETRNRLLVNGRATTLAAAWCCLPLLRAKVEADPTILRKRNPLRNIKVALFNRPRPISLLEASALSWVSRSMLSLPEWDNPLRKKGHGPARMLTKWHIYLRLETVKFLLQNNAKPDRSFKKRVKTYAQRSQGTASLEHIYWSLVDELFDNKSNLTSYNVRQRLLLEVDELPPKDFPEL